MTSSGEAVRSVVLTAYGGYECLKVRITSYRWRVADGEGNCQLALLMALCTGETLAHPSAWCRWCPSGCSSMWNEFCWPLYPPGADSCSAATLCSGNRVCWAGNSCGSQCRAHQGEHKTLNCWLWLCLQSVSASDNITNTNISAPVTCSCIPDAHVMWHDIQYNIQHGKL
jgi:hypothetical protein